MLALLNTILMPRKGEPTVTPKEAAHLFGYRSDRMVYAILAGEKSLKGEHYQMLAFECAKRGDLRLHEATLPNQFHVAHNDECGPNGCIEDEATAMLTSAGAFCDAYQRGDMLAMDLALPQVEKAFAGFKAERRLVKV